MAVNVNGTTMRKINPTSFKTVLVNNELYFAVPDSVIVDSGTITYSGFDFNDYRVSYTRSSDDSLRVYFSFPSNFVLKNVSVNVGNNFHQAEIVYRNQQIAGIVTNNSNISWQGSISGGGTLIFSYNTISYGGRSNNMKIVINDIPVIFYI